MAQRASSRGGATRLASDPNGSASHQVPQRLSITVWFEKNLKDLNINHCSVILERIEVPEGAHGTLAGSGAEAGLLH
jgi:hypothetical protein